jgi:hypothetical protein
MAEMYLRVYGDKSELVHADGGVEIFLEGTSSTEARQRYQSIVDALEGGFLERQIEGCKRGNASALGFHQLRDEERMALERLAGSITSEVGRALVALTILQLCVKAIAPTQSIRLHKGGGGKHSFSWREGISMRSLDSRFVTPTLRKHDLLRLNADGFMMTRSLAENYPYSLVYKAQMRGGRSEWLQLVEYLEAGTLQPELALRYVLAQLLNRAEQFTRTANTLLMVVRQFMAKADEGAILKVITDHIQQSDYAARVMEIAMHSLMQGLAELRALDGGDLVPLSQMRSANKKHGNVGDVEISHAGQIIEAWDAKFGKNYLRDELEELAEKLTHHPDVTIAGFVTSELPERLNELRPRIAELQDNLGVELLIVTFDQWVERQMARAIAVGVAVELSVARRWLIAFAESFAQKRPTIAPIDEPCQQWVESLTTLLQTAGTQIP